MGATQAIVAEFTVSRDAIASLTSMVFVLPTADFWDLVDWCRAYNPSHYAAGYYDVVYGPVSADYRNRTVHTGFDQVSFHNATNVSVLGVPRWRAIR